MKIITKLTICGLITSVFVTALIGTTLMQTRISGTNAHLLRAKTITNTTMEYDIYKDNQLLATVSNYEELQCYLTTKFSDAIAYGNGKLFFADNMSVIERYSEHQRQEDNIQTYEHIAEQGSFKVSAIQITSLDTLEDYYVPNMHVWDEGVKEVGEVIGHLENDALNTVMTFEENIEYNIVETDITNMLTPEKLVKKLMDQGLNEYVVQSGDTMQSIAKQYMLSVAELLLLNPSYHEQTLLLVGSTVYVTTTTYRDSYTKISVIERNEPVLYEYEYIDDTSLYTGQEVVEQEGIDGEKRMQISVKYTKDMQEVILNQTELYQVVAPTHAIIRRGTKESPDVGTGNFTWPTKSRRTSTEFGDDYLRGQYRWHAGLDINEGANADIMAVDNGVIVTNTYSSGYGNYVIINHNNGYWSLYAHLLQPSKLRVGEVVRQGAVIGGMGSTGDSTGVHLHLEIRKGANTKEAARNPRDYIVY